MYPFERFTEGAKKTLTRAQEEAERSRHSYIGTEHIVLALVSQQGTVASETLARLGVNYDRLLEQVNQVLGKNERIIIQQIIPTSRVKKVIEMAFVVAQQAGENYVGTEHLLLGLLEEGEGIGARVLVDSGATLDAVRATVAQVRDSGVREEAAEPRPRVVSPERGSTRVFGWQVGAVVAGAETEARQDLDDSAGDIHILRHLITRGDRRVLAALRRLGVNPADLRAALTPPERVVELRRALKDTVAAKRSAVAREDFEAAAAARESELELRSQLVLAERLWEESLEADP